MSSSRKRRAENRSIRLAYMGNRCRRCGKTVRAVERRYGTSGNVFHFNHVNPRNKAPNYERLIERAVCSEQFDELDKCVMLCTECHGILHAQNFNGKGTTTLTLADGRVVREDFRFQCLIDFLKPKFHLFGDDPRLLHVFRYQLGCGEVVLATARELEAALLGLMVATRRGGELQIWDGQGLVFKVASLDKRHAEVNFPVRFSLIKAELRTGDPSNPVIWIRNGKLIDRQRGVRSGGHVRLQFEYSELEKAERQARRKRRSA